MLKLIFVAFIAFLAGISAAMDASAGDSHVQLEAARAYHSALPTTGASTNHHRSGIAKPAPASLLPDLSNEMPLRTTSDLSRNQGGSEGMEPSPLEPPLDRIPEEYREFFKDGLEKAEHTMNSREILEKPITVRFSDALFSIVETRMLNKGEQYAVRGFLMNSRISNALNLKFVNGKSLDDCIKDSVLNLKKPARHQPIRGDRANIATAASYVRSMIEYSKIHVIIKNILDQPAAYPSGTGVAYDDNYPATVRFSPEESKPQWFGSGSSCNVEFSFEPLEATTPAHPTTTPKSTQTAAPTSASSLTTPTPPSSTPTTPSNQLGGSRISRGRGKLLLKLPRTSKEIEFSRLEAEITYLGKDRPANTVTVAVTPTVSGTNDPDEIVIFKGHFV